MGVSGYKKGEKTAGLLWGFLRAVRPSQPAPWQQSSALESADGGRLARIIQRTSQNLRELHIGLVNFDIETLGGLSVIRVKEHESYQQKFRISASVYEGKKLCQATVDGWITMPKNGDGPMSVHFSDTASIGTGRKKRLLTVSKNVSRQAGSFSFRVRGHAGFLAGLVATPKPREFYSRRNVIELR